MNGCCTALADGTRVPRLGQGTWHMGSDKYMESQEIASVRFGIDLGMTLIDTAEMYADGGAEAMLGKAIAGVERESLFLVSKVYPYNADRKNMFQSCEASLRRLGVEYLDCYLLHWRGMVPLAETAECMRELQYSGKIRRWGVSNFDVADMKELWKKEGGGECVTNQVLYHLGSRGVEHSLLPWMEAHQMPAMAYSPLAQGGALGLGPRLSESPLLREIAAENAVTVMQLLLAFVLRRPDVIAIPKASNADHVKQNAAALELRIPESDWARIDAEFPAPRFKTTLDMS